MKNKTILFIPLTLFTLLLIFFSIPKITGTQITHKKTKTVAELKQETILFKKNRRASGWGKPDKPSEFVDYHLRIRTKYGFEKHGYKQNYKIEEYEKAMLRTINLKSAQKYNWTERGPGNVSGRTRGLLIDPDDPNSNTWFVGSAGGGIWKTTNAGQSWINLTPDMPVLSTVCLGISQSNTSVIYSGTGEGFNNGDAIMGDGIFKSTNKGKTWLQLPSTSGNANFKYVNRLVVSPSSENIVVAATNTSIQKTTDGGVSWRKVFSPNGRVQQVLDDPRNFEILYAAVHGMGIVKSIDAGDTWNWVFTNTVGRIEMAISPTSSNLIYALNENSELFVSYNSGKTWASSQITSGSRDVLLGSQGWYNNTMAVSPIDTNTLFVGGVNLYQIKVTGKSQSKSTLTNVYTVGTEQFMDFVDHGATYLGGSMEVTESVTNYNKIEVRFGSNKKQKAYRFVVPVGSTSGVPDEQYSYSNYIEVPFEVWDTGNNKQLMVSFRDQDRNGVFNLTEHNDNLFIGREYVYIHNVGYSQTPNLSIAKDGGQTYNKLAFWWPVIATGATWDAENLPEYKIVIERTAINTLNLTSTKIADWSGAGAPYIHADLHNIQFVKLKNGSFRMVVANDGGLAYSDDMGKTWKNPTNGYNTTQFYGIDKHPTEDRYVGGMQDNGSWISPLNPSSSSSWTEATGGDGFDAVWNASNPKRIVSSVYNNKLWVSFDGGNTWKTNISGLTDTQSKAPFITQIGYNPILPNKLFLTGQSGVWYSNDFGKAWLLAEMPTTGWGWYKDSYVEPSISCPDIVWAASQLTNDSRILVSENGGYNFKTTAAYKETMGTLSGLATHPSDDKTAYALFSFAGTAKILRTTDLGKSWNDITGFVKGKSANGFPDVATYCLLVMPNNTDEIWVGTEIGIVISTDNGKNWQLANNGLPAVSIWELKIRGTQVIVATHGRGVFTTDIPEIANAPKAPKLNGVALSANNKVNLQYINQSNYDSIEVLINSQKKITIGSNPTYGEKQTAVVEKPSQNGNSTAQIIAYISGRALKSVTLGFDVFELKEPVFQYENNFDTLTDDFYGKGFEIISHNALNNNVSIHTSHPYEENLDISYMLKYPIIVKKDTEIGKALLSFRDIAFVEQGESGLTFESEDFYDYVTVQATKNGIDWMPIIAGYDFSDYKTKAAKYGLNIDSKPKPELFLERQIDLLKYFNNNDTILIRFFLHSDPFSAGWGWVIDDINIQTPRKNSVPDYKTKNKAYPIPCKNELNIELSDTFAGNAHITITDINGKKLNTIVSTNETTVNLNTSALIKGVYYIEIRNGNNSERIKIVKD